MYVFRGNFEAAAAVSFKLYTALDSLSPHGVDRDNHVMLNSHPPHLILYTSASVGQNAYKQPAAVFWESVCLFWNCWDSNIVKWIIYICTVYNFQVHEMDYQRLILVMKKKILQHYIYIYTYIYTVYILYVYKVCEHFSDELLSFEH